MTGVRYFRLSFSLGVGMTSNSHVVDFDSRISLEISISERVLNSVKAVFTCGELRLSVLGDSSMIVLSSSSLIFAIFCAKNCKN